MNNTKWNEIFNVFYQNECDKNTLLIRWRTKDLRTGYISNWERSWTHFGCAPRNWESIDYLQIELTTKNQEFVLQELKKIHVPGTISNGVATIYGHRQDVDYII
ncbi:DUF6678 family protein [Allofournierella massiliensis]|uniref:Uncharacterized protein n=1 Tax=Allofournierella massiliensis TaxID=1650663 RepID=A0ABT7UT03_9FIRM|nr:DUF6678 family protein [Fournierella massiliensis]MDM8202021.1 hypothetical protein [Fournierella massiliensis]